MTWKVPVLGAVLLAGSGLVVLAGSALVSSKPSAEKGERQITAGANAAEAKLDVRGMTCGACATTARVAFERIAGVHDAEVSAESGRAIVRYDRALTQPAQFIPEFERMTGYEATIADERSAHDSGATDAAAEVTSAAPAPPPTSAER